MLLLVSPNSSCCPKATLLRGRISTFEGILTNNFHAVVVWLDSGSSFTDRPTSKLPWCVSPPESYYFPVVLHKFMVALKAHLFSSSKDATARSASHIPMEYGRSLHPNVMAQDAFYSLTEVFDFSASSQMAFLNMINAKLDQYTSLPPERDFESLPHLRYTKDILYDYILKTKRTIDSIKSAREGRWPKDQTASGQRKATTAAQRIEEDFLHLQYRAEILHHRANDAITVLMSSIAINESQKAITQGARMQKLTYLAFIFVPLSFTTGFFGMNVREFSDDKIDIRLWAYIAVPVTVLAIALFSWDIYGYLSRMRMIFKEWMVKNGLWFM